MFKISKQRKLENKKFTSHYIKQNACSATSITNFMINKSIRIQ